MVHELFGFELDRMKDVTVRFEPTEDTVKVYCQGPHKQIGWGMRQLIGMKKNYHFNDVWTTYFSPIYSVYDHFWTDPETGAEALVKWRAYVFFTPVDDTQTRVTTLTYAKSRFPVGKTGGLSFFRGFTRRKANHEIGMDVGILQSLASHNTSLEGMKLSRFDKALGLNRERIESIYRGNDGSRQILKMAQGE